MQIRFRKQNKSLGLPAQGEQRVVFMGNSITEGWPNKDPEFFENPNYINRGIGGQTTPQMLLRFRADVIALQPKVVVILAGTNDIAGNTGPMTLEEIGETFDLTRERVRQIKEKAIRRLKHTSRSKILKTYIAK